MGMKTRTVALLALCALLSAAALSACGGGDDTTASTAVETTADGAPAPADEKPIGGGAAPDQPAGAGRSGDSEDTEGDGVGGTNVQPDERSSKFVTPGGDNSIQEFGSEGGSDERAEALKAIDAVTKANQSGEWAQVCNEYMSAKNLEQFEKLTEKVPQFEGKDCPEILHALNPGRKIDDSSVPQDGIASIRGDDKNAFALYRGKDGKGYAWPFAREDGALKLVSLAPTPLEF